MVNCNFHIVNHAELRWDVICTPEAGKLFGHNPASFIKYGYDYTILQMHPQYLDFSIQGSTRIMLDTYYSTPVEKRKQIEVYKDFWYKHIEGHNYRYFRVHQKTIIMELDNYGRVALTLNQTSDGTHLKREHDASLIIKKANGNFHIYKYSVHEKSIFDFGILNDRELSILKLLSVQLTSRQIGELLHISPNTVDTYRRILLDKTNCIDTTALVTYAKMLGIV